jgi:hypothetical protein
MRLLTRLALILSALTLLSLTTASRPAEAIFSGVSCTQVVDPVCLVNKGDVVTFTVTPTWWGYDLIPPQVDPLHIATYGCTNRFCNSSTGGGKDPGPTIYQKLGVIQPPPQGVTLSPISFSYVASTDGEEPYLSPNPAGWESGYKNACFWGNASHDYPDCPGCPNQCVSGIAQSYSRSNLVVYKNYGASTPNIHMLQSLVPIYWKVYWEKLRLNMVGQFKTQQAVLKLAIWVDQANKATYIALARNLTRSRYMLMEALAAAIADPIDYDYTTLPPSQPYSYDLATVSTPGNTQAQADAINAFQLHSSEMYAYIRQATHAADKVNGALLAGDIAAAVSLAQYLDERMTLAQGREAPLNAAATAMALAFQNDPIAGTPIDTTPLTAAEVEVWEIDCWTTSPLPTWPGQCTGLAALVGAPIDPAIWPALLGAQTDYSDLGGANAAAHLQANIGKIPTYMEFSFGGGAPNGTITNYVHRKDGVGQPVGVVSYYMDGVLQGTAPLDASGKAVYNTFTPEGVHTWTPVFEAQNGLAESYYYAHVVITGVYVPDTTPPVVSGFLPASGTTVPKGSTVLLKATVADAVGAVLVQTYVNGVLKCSAAPGPYVNNQLTCSWTTPNLNGKKTYTILWKATDAAGNIGQLSGTIKTN